MYGIEMPGETSQEAGRLEQYNGDEKRIERKPDNWLITLAD